MEGNLEDEGINDQSNVSDSSSIENQIDTEVADELEFIADEFGVTKEDLEALGPLDLSMDLGEDEQLKQRTHPVDFAGENLDVPGTADDDAQEEIGAEDEENNSYSVGGDGHTDLEEGRQ